jgi:hypothetical protein
VTEASVRAALVKKLRAYKDWVVLRHEDHYTSGIPDISVTGNKITSWWECKLKQQYKSLSTKGIQRYLVEQLGKHGNALHRIPRHTAERCHLHTRAVSRYGLLRSGGRTRS